MIFPSLQLPHVDLSTSKDASTVFDYATHSSHTHLDGPSGQKVPSLPSTSYGTHHSRRYFRWSVQEAADPAALDTSVTPGISWTEKKGHRAIRTTPAQPVDSIVIVAPGTTVSTPALEHELGATRVPLGLPSRVAERPPPVSQTEPSSASGSRRVPRNS